MAVRIDTNISMQSDISRQSGSATTGPVTIPALGHPALGVPAEISTQGYGNPSSVRLRIVCSWVGCSLAALFYLIRRQACPFYFVLRLAVHAFVLRVLWSHQTGTSSEVE